MEGQKNQNRAMVTWYGQHIRFEQGSCQFLRGGRGGRELFYFQRLELGGVFCAGQSSGPAGWFEIFIIFFFTSLFFLFPLPYLTLPICTLLTLDPCFFSLSLYEDGLSTRRRVPYSS